jgi:hypothetical protein
MNGRQLRVVPLFSCRSEYKGPRQIPPKFQDQNLARTRRGIYVRTTELLHGATEHSARPENLMDLAWVMTNRGAPGRVPHSAFFSVFLRFACQPETLQSFPVLMECFLRAFVLSHCLRGIHLFECLPSLAFGRRDGLSFKGITHQPYSRQLRRYRKPSTASTRSSASDLPAKKSVTFCRVTLS